MLRWLAENPEGIVALLTIAGAVVALLTRAGLIQKQRGDVLTGVFEDSADVMERAAAHIDLRNASKSDIAKVFTKALKAEVRQRGFKTGVKAVVGAIADGAANADPDPAKLPRGPLRRLFALMRPKVLGG
jgi:hypothetical protein